MRFWKIVLLALNGLRRTPLRFVLTSLGVAIATGALVSMVAFALGIQRQAEEPFRKLGLLNNIEVTARRGGGDDDFHDRRREREGEPSDGEASKDKEPGPPLDEAALARIAGLPEVETAYPDFRFVQLKVIRGETEERALAVGVPREVSFLAPLRELLLAGAFFSQDGSPEAVLGKRLCGELGFESPEAAVGQEINLEASGLTPSDEETFRFERREFAVTVVGVYDPPALAQGLGAGGIVLPVDLMLEIPGIRFSPALRQLRAGGSATEAGFSRVIVRVRRPADLAPAQKAIEGMGYRARTVLDEIEQMRTFFLVIDVCLAALGTVALVVAGLGIINTLVMSVLERFREIGLCKAIGASDADVRILFLTEAGLVGFAGGVAGLILGRSVSWVLEIAVNAYARSQGVPIDVAVFAFPLGLVVGAVGFATVVSILAGVYPASRASRVDPIRALRGE